MPRGGARAPKKIHKGKRRQFTDVDQLETQLKREERERAWRREKGEESSEEEEEGKSRGGYDANAAARGLPPSSSEEDSSSEEEEQKHKGVEHLIEIQNPNRVVKKNKKIDDLDMSSGTSLSRREREEIEKQQAKQRYQQLHMEGKTDEARADLARLALIRKQREEAAKKREEEKKEREEQEKAKSKKS